MKMKKTLFALFCIAFSSANLLGVLKTTITNNSKANIEAMGYGLGCAGVVLGRGLMCSTKPIVIAPGKSAQVPYQKKIAATKGGIRLLSMENGAMYDLQASTKPLNDQLTFSVEESGNFKQISKNLKKVMEKVIPELSKTRQTKDYYYVVFANDKNGKMAIFAEGAMPLDGTLKIGVDNNFVPMYQVDQYKSSDVKANKDFYKIKYESKNFKE